MTTFAAPPDSERHDAELEARTRVAWTTYSDDLRELEGQAYEDAEPAAWEQLQATLLMIDALRAVHAPEAAAR